MHEKSFGRSDRRFASRQVDAQDVPHRHNNLIHLNEKKRIINKNNIKLFAISNCKLNYKLENDKKKLINTSWSKISKNLDACGFGAAGAGELSNGGDPLL